MRSDAHSKVTAEHRRRSAFLYVRQSTMRQVLENTQSTARQYDLRKRAISLGWSSEQVVVIDTDLGQSGASSVDRDGFQKLVAEVGMGHAGVVMGLEVSRLARNCSDWHRLVEICAVTDTLILDEDGIYDPSDFNDRLVLGFKGTMSEAELHLLRARLRGGMLNKARKGELAMRLPVGFAYDPQGRVVLSPDKQVQTSIRLLFETFARLGSARAVVVTFRKQDLQFPMRVHTGLAKGEIVWKPLTDSRARDILQNPRYAGAYVYGRRTQRKAGLDRHVSMVFLPRDQWHTLIPNAHEGYITWDHYENHVKQLEANSRSGQGPRRCPPREGPALLQGLAVCGICGARMSIRYHHRRDILSPDYVCNGKGNTHCLPKCQSIPGDGIDQAVGRLLLEVVTPMALEVALAVQQEVQAAIDEADRLRHQQVERAQFEADLARHTYMRVNPDNRLVADSLEANWNQKLRDLAQAQEEYERRRDADRLVLTDDMQKQVLGLASDFPKLWNDPKTPDRERKRTVRLIIEDVTLIKDGNITAHVRFKGGATRSLTLARPLASWEERALSGNIVTEIDQLLDAHTPGEIASILNAKGLLSGCGRSFHGNRVGKICRAYNLKSRYERLREKGLLTLDEIAGRLGLSKGTVKIKRTQGKLAVGCLLLSDDGQYMFEDPARPGAEQRSIPSTSSNEV